MKNAVDYLRDNDISISTGLLFTCNDYDFITQNNFTTITINQGKQGREETLTKKDIVKRIKDLFFLYKHRNSNISHYPPTINEKAIQKILDDNKENIVFIDDLDISVRCYQTLKQKNINTLNDVLNYDEKELRKNISNKTWEEIQEQLKKFNLI